MAKDGSVAPRERVNIVYKAAIDGQQEEVELPLKLLMMGDYTGRMDGTPLDERKPINVDKDNFDEVLGSQKLAIDASVPNRLGGDGDLTVRLSFKKMSDFGPEAVVNQVPELKKLLELRGALTALKGPLGNLPAFRKKIQELLQDESARQKVLGELGIKKDEG